MKNLPLIPSGSITENEKLPNIHSKRVVKESKNVENCGIVNSTIPIEAKVTSRIVKSKQNLAIYLLISKNFVSKGPRTLLS